MLETIMPGRVEPPTTTTGHSGYGRECALALEPPVTDLVKRAVASGWDELEVAMQIVSLCERYIYGSDER